MVRSEGVQLFHQINSLEGLTSVVRALSGNDDFDNGSYLDGRRAILQLSQVPINDTLRPSVHPAKSHAVSAMDPERP